MDGGQASRRAWVAVGVLTLIAAVVRARVFGAGWTGEELAGVRPLTVVGHLLEAENGVNPPLQRLLFNTLFPDRLVITAWRTAGFVASVAAVPLVALVATRGARRAWVAPLAALLVTFQPLLVQQSVVARSYPLLVALYAANLWAALTLLDDAEDARAGRVLTVTLALLPHLHYTSVPLLGVEALALLALGLPWRRLVALAWPAAIVVAPLAIYVLGVDGMRHAGPPPDVVVRRMLEVGAAGTAPVTAGLLAVGLLLWPWWGRAERLLVVQAAAVVPMVWAAAHVHHVRNTLGVFLLVPLLPLVARGIGRLPGVAAVAVAVGVVVPYAGHAWWAVKDPAFLGLPSREGLGDVAEVMRSGRFELEGEVVWLDAFPAVPYLYLLLEGVHPDRDRGDWEVCGDEMRCFVWEGVEVRGLGEGVPVGMVFGVNGEVPERLEGCVEVGRGETWWLVECSG